MTNRIKVSLLKRYGMLSLLLAQSAYADLSYLDLKGVDESIGNHPGLNPSIAYLQLDRALPNRRFYGNYGPKNKDFSCDGPRSKIDDCPQDANSEWLQLLFPSPDGTNFVANQSGEPVSKFTPHLMGKLLERISDVPDSEWENRDAMSRLETELKNLMFSELNPSAFQAYYVNEKEKTEKALASSTVKLQKCTDPAREQERASYVSRIRILQNQLDEINRFLGPSSADAASAASGNYNSAAGEYAKIAKVFIGALIESRIPGGHYPKHLPEQALLAFFIKKANGKDDLLSLFDGMRSKLTPHGKAVLSDPNVFKASRWEVAHDYKPAVWVSNPHAIAERFASEPSFLIFATQQEKVDEKAIPPILSYGTAQHEETSYPDCGETSARNFFNIVLFNQGGFNSERLDSIAAGKPDVKVYPALKDFYKTHSDPAKASSKEARDAWSRLVSAHPGVNYLKGGQKCEINAGIDNMMTVLDRLLYHDVLGGGPIAKASTRSAKLDRLCEVVSREGFKLTWNKKDQKKVDSSDTGIDVEFSINGNPSFQWQFMSGHFSILSLAKSKESWKNQVETVMVAYSKDATKYPSLIPFVNSRTFEEFSRHAPKGSLIYSLPCSTNEEKLKMLEQFENFDPPHTLIAEKIIRRLPLDDQYTQDRVALILIKKKAPYGMILEHFKKNDLTRKVAVFRAAANGDIELIRKMHADGFDFTVKDPLGYTPAHSAAEVGELDVVKFIIENVPGAMMVANDDGLIPAHMAAAARLKSDVLKLIAEKVPQAMMVQDRRGNTPVHDAARLNQWDFLKFIAEKVPQTMMVKNNSSHTPPHQAAYMDKWDVVQFIAEKVPEAMMVQDRDRKNLLDLAKGSRVDTKRVDTKAVIRAIEAAIEKMTPGR